jgi:hypothetical protein
MKLKNKIILALGVLCALAVQPIQAQVPTYAAQTISGIPTVLAAGTTNYPLAVAPYIDTSKQTVVAFASTIKGTGAIGATNLYYFAPTVDGIYYDTNSTHLILATNTVSAATTTNTSVQFWNTYGAKGYALITIVTTGTSTNLNHAYGVKISAP